MRKISSKCKLCRREGVKLFLKGERCKSAKCAMVKKNYKPGVHGPKKAMTKMSAYGKQLREKQKAKRVYGMLEKQFKTLSKKAMRDKKDSGKKLLSLLEKRFDNIIFRLKLAPSRISARQLISHSQFTINGRTVNIASFTVKIGDKIAVKDIKSKSKYWEKIKESIKNEKDIPTWLALDNKNLTAQITAEPDVEDVANFIDSSLIIEFYSR
ncbi:MAG: 30S ribosomal protein S4 [Patescibacteria group bacterium]|nr:30S ribosomal protein S4 [Patescibacteria group bacterium]